jgi:D-sedoheptulose 7-phosphate isomerase
MEAVQQTHLTWQQNLLTSSRKTDLAFRLLHLIPIWQLKSLSEEGDVVVALSTSGNSPNVLKAVDVAKKKKLITIAFTGIKGEKLSSKSMYAFVVPSDNTPRIQETHITLGHVICQMVEEILFEAPRKR